MYGIFTYVYHNNNQPNVIIIPYVDGIVLKLCSHHPSIMKFFNKLIVESWYILPICYISGI